MIFATIKTEPRNHRWNHGKTHRHPSSNSSLDVRLYLTKYLLTYLDYESFAVQYVISNLILRVELTLLFTLPQEWIITAAHCFCTMCSIEQNPKNCTKAPQGCISDHTGRKTVVNFDLKRVKVYVGKYVLPCKFRG